MKLTEYEEQVSFLLVKARELLKQTRARDAAEGRWVHYGLASAIAAFTPSGHFPRDCTWCGEQLSGYPDQDEHTDRHHAEHGVTVGQPGGVRIAMNCPECGAALIYQGLTEIECDGRGCKNSRAPLILGPVTIVGPAMIRVRVEPDGPWVDFPLPLSSL
jgi:hypothetical protein